MISNYLKLVKSSQEQCENYQTRPNCGQKHTKKTKTGDQNWRKRLKEFKNYHKRLNMIEMIKR